MSESRSAELDVNQLMATIREAVARRQAGGETSLLESSAALRNLLADCEVASVQQIEVARLNLQPEFNPSRNGRYHVNDLLQYHDRDFVRNAYRALLKREPDDSGYNHYLDSLRSGRLTKQEIIVILRASPEGRNKAIRIDGLRLPLLREQLYRIPGLRYLVQWVMAWVRLPIMMRHHSQFQAYSVAQHQRLADHTDEVSALLTQRFSQLFSEVLDSQKQIASLQHQQIGSLFREQQELGTQQKILRDELFAQPSVEQVRIMLDEAGKGLVAVPEVERPSNTLTPEERQQVEAFYASFEDRFRGAPEDIKEGLRIYLPHLREAGIQTDILDLGCGRGDWLELLREEGLGGRGVEMNAILVEQCRSAGFEVIEADMLEHLRTLPDKSVDAVTGFHVIEHVPFEKLILLVAEIVRILKPGGLIILESPSPENLVVAACNFYADPTHHKPVFPHTLKFLLMESGLANVRLEFLHPVKDSPYADGKGVLQALHTWFYGPRDFAVIGSKV
jgi:O-antigen chain-terminating methyltransferase